MNGQSIVYVVDDDKAVRDSLEWLIESVGLKVETFGTAQDFLDRAEVGIGGCLVADLRLPGMSGLDMQAALKERGINIATIFITGHGDVPVAVRAMQNGALDFIEKPFSDQVLLDRIREALQRDEVRQSSESEVSEVRARYERLTPRERQVMAQVVEGKLNKQIAAALDLSHKTIEVHRAHVMEKMGAGSLAELVRMAVAMDGAAEALIDHS